MTFFVALLSILSAFHFETMEFQTRPPHKLQRLELQNVTQLHHAGLQDEPHKTTGSPQLGRHLPTQAFRHRPNGHRKNGEDGLAALMDRLKTAHACTIRSPNNAPLLFVKKTVHPHCLSNHDSGQ